MLQILLDVLAATNAPEARDQPNRGIGFDHGPCPSRNRCRTENVRSRRRAISDRAATRTASSEDLFDCARNRVYLGHSVDRAEDPTVAIIRQDRRRLTMVDFEPRLDRLRPVVGAARKLAAAANIADLVDLGPV